jgi:NAD-dependent deacetylase
LRRRFDAGQRVLVLTGAGVSAESGVPTFRGGGNTAVWKGMPFDVISSAEMVERDLPAVWEWFDYRRNFSMDHLRTGALRDRPLAGTFSGVHLVTQNIDGLHQRRIARVIELARQHLARKLHGCRRLTICPKRTSDACLMRRCLRRCGSLWRDVAAGAFELR